MDRSSSAQMLCQSYVGHLDARFFQLEGPLGVEKLVESRGMFCCTDVGIASAGCGVIQHSH